MWPFFWMVFSVMPMENCLFLICVAVCFFPDDDDRDIQGDRAVDYGKRHQAIDILWMGTCNFLDNVIWTKIQFIGCILSVMDYFEERKLQLINLFLMT